MSLVLALITVAIGIIPLMIGRHRHWRPTVIFGLINTAVLWLVYYTAVPSLVWPFFGAVGGFVLAMTAASAGIACLLEEQNRPYRLMLIPAVLGLLFIGRCTYGTDLFRASEYASLVGIVEERVWTEDVQPTDPQHVRLVPPELALYLARKRLGEAEGAIGSQYQLSEDHTTIQRVNGELWYVIPLDFSGFTVWTASEGVPGYVKVHAEDPNRQPVVVSNQRFRYMPGAYFGDNLERHLWSHGYMTAGLTDYTLELDEEGRALWVITVFKPTIGWWGEMVEGVVIVDPKNGAHAFYLPALVPDWVDRVVPGEFVRDRLAWNGEYAAGWWNSVWAKVGITVPDEPDVVYGSDGRAYWVTGLTSANAADDSLVAVVYTDTREGRSVRYRVAGGTDKAVLEAVNNRVAFMQRHGASPVPYNIYGRMTAVTPVLGKDSTFQGVAIVSIESMQAAVGNNAIEAFREYQKLVGAAVGMVPDMARDQRTLVLPVDRFAAVVQQDGTVFYLTLAGEHPIFVGASSLSPDLPLTRPGDTVRVRYIVSTERVVPLTEFGNQMMAPLTAGPGEPGGTAAEAGAPVQPEPPAEPPTNP